MHRNRMHPLIFDGTWTNEIAYVSPTKIVYLQTRQTLPPLLASIKPVVKKPILVQVYVSAAIPTLSNPTVIIVQDTKKKDRVTDFICGGKGTCYATFDAIGEYTGMGCACSTTEEGYQWTGRMCECLQEDADYFCEACASGYFGNRCGPCPGGGLLDACDGHGTCQDGCHRFRILYLSLGYF